MNLPPESVDQSKTTPRVFTRKLRWLGIILLSFVSILLISQSTLGWRRERSLHRAVEHAGHMSISRSFTSPRKELANTMELNGANSVAEFLDLIDIDELRTIPGGECRCWGDVQIEFRDGDQKLARIAFAHGNSLKWHKGNWSGDSTLTQESAAAIGAWLNKHAPPLVGPPAPTSDR